MRTARPAAAACSAPASQSNGSPRRRNCAGLRNGYRNPAQLGCDRFAAAIGAHALAPGKALIVATCGTATTVDAVTRRRRFPGRDDPAGPGLMAGSLAQQHRAAAAGRRRAPRRRPRSPTTPTTRSCPAAWRPRPAPSSAPGRACAAPACASCPAAPRATSHRALRCRTGWSIISCWSACTPRRYLHSQWEIATC